MKFTKTELDNLAIQGRITDYYIGSKHILGDIMIMLEDVSIRDYYHCRTLVKKGKSSIVGYSGNQTHNLSPSHELYDIGFLYFFDSEEEFTKARMML